MAYTVHRIRTEPENLATELKSYLDGTGITTLHTISIHKFGSYVQCFIVFE